jgi:putative heme iron utilization protein
MLLSEYLEPYQSAILGTLGENGYPFSSYAPFYYDGKDLYIFISNIATHTQNINRNPKASMLFIEDESTAEKIFARKRISLQCDVSLITRDDASFDSIMKPFVQKQGHTLSMLMSMSDFNLYKLSPIYGEATFDFGVAYHVGGDDMNMLVTRVGDSGHE